ncbi:MAG: hypothetical protein IT221_06635 [Fluviicola sp.]|jgi:hypothetical protein|nr:hypothetical protein [Fluviicola sp.]
MGLKEQQAAIERELERFMDLLNSMLPRYSKLLKKANLNDDELKELGDIEHFLIGVTGRISEIKRRLEQDVFGHSLDAYYKTKLKAQLGDENAIKKMNKLKETFRDSLHSGGMVLWN